MSKKDPDCVKFGAAIRTLREKQKLSQEDFAKKAGVHRTFMGGIERGERNPTLKTMMKIAECLGVTLPQLIQEMEQQ